VGCYATDSTLPVYITNGEPSRHYGGLLSNVKSIQMNCTASAALVFMFFIAITPGTLSFISHACYEESLSAITAP